MIIAMRYMMMENATPKMRVEIRTAGQAPVTESVFAMYGMVNWVPRGVNPTRMNASKNALMSVSPRWLRPLLVLSISAYFLPFSVRNNGSYITIFV